MIYLALKALVLQMNDYLRVSFGLTQDIVHLAPVHREQNSESANQVSVSIVGMERDNAGGVRFEKQMSDARHIAKAPKWQISLHVLFAVIFKDKQYGESIQVFTAVLSFLQRNTMILVPDTNKKYAIEPVNLSYSDQSSLWGMLDTPYSPSVLCQLRMISVDDGEIIEISSAVTGQDAQLSTT